MLRLLLHEIYGYAVAFHLELWGCWINQIMHRRYLEAVILPIEAQYAEIDTGVCKLAVYVLFCMLADAIYATCYIQSAAFNFILNLTSQGSLRSPIHTCLWLRSSISLFWSSPRSEASPPALLQSSLALRLSPSDSLSPPSSLGFPPLSREPCESGL